MFDSISGLKRLKRPPHASTLVLVRPIKTTRTTHVVFILFIYSAMLRMRILGFLFSGCSEIKYMFLFLCSLFAIDCAEKWWITELVSILCISTSLASHVWITFTFFRAKWEFIKGDAVTISWWYCTSCVQGFYCMKNENAPFFLGV